MSKDETAKALVENAKMDAKTNALIAAAMPLIERNATLYGSFYATEKHDLETLKKMAKQLAKIEEDIGMFLDEHDAKTADEELCKHLRAHQDVVRRWETLYGYLYEEKRMEIENYRQKVEDYLAVPAISAADEKKHYLRYRAEFVRLKEMTEEMENLVRLSMPSTKLKNNYSSILIPTDSYSGGRQLMSQLRTRTLPRAGDVLRSLQEDLFRHSDYAHEARTVKYLLVTTLFAVLGFIVSLLNLWVDANKQDAQTPTIIEVQNADTVPNVE